MLSSIFLQYCYSHLQGLRSRGSRQTGGTPLDRYTGADIELLTAKSGTKKYFFNDFDIAASTPDTLDTSEMNSFRSQNILAEEKDRLKK